jgi:sugar lactone lactonase YvrE
MQGEDAAQQFLYLADAGNEKVHILRRDSLQELKAFGDGGHYPDQFFGVHNLAVDSKGNLYTGETFDGKRVQRFLNKGMGAITSQNQ